MHGHFYIYKPQSLDKSFRRWRQNGGSDKYFCPMTTWPIVTILGHWVTLQFNFLKTAMLIVTIAVWSIPIKRGILILKLLPEFYRRSEIRSIFFILKNLLYSHTCKNNDECILMMSMKPSSKVVKFIPLVSGVQT